MARMPLPIQTHDALQEELALTLQVLYTLGLVEEDELPGVIRQVGPLDEAHKTHTHTRILLEHGVHMHLITPYSTRAIAGPHSEAYLRDIWGGFFPPDEVDELIATQQAAMQSRAVYLQGYAEYWPDQWSERVGRVTRGDVLAALEHGAVVHMRIGPRPDPHNVLAVPATGTTDQVWVYDLTTWQTVNRPMLSVAEAAQEQIHIFNATPIRA